MDSKQTGIWGEKIAENYLIKKGYQILDKNYSTNFNSGPQRGEVDLVTKKDNMISFIEVKTQTQNQRELFSLIRPEQKVNFLKQRKIIKTAEFWLMEEKIPLDSKWQIDVIAIKIDFKSKLAKIRHFKNSVF
jgi:putative endonuclease